jgi:hypothetical protein
MMGMQNLTELRLAQCLTYSSDQTCKAPVHKTLPTPGKIVKNWHQFHLILGSISHSFLRLRLNLVKSTIEFKVNRLSR